MSRRQVLAAGACMPSFEWSSNSAEAAVRKRCSCHSRKQGDARRGAALSFLLLSFLLLSFLAPKGSASRSHLWHPGNMDAP